MPQCSNRTEMWVPLREAETRSTTNERNKKKSTHKKRKKLSHSKVDTEKSKYKLTALHKREKKTKTGLLNVIGCDQCLSTRYLEFPYLCVGVANECVEKCTLL